MAKKTIAPKKKAFAKSYFQTKQKKDSAIKAGYSPRTASSAATRLLKDQDVIRELERLSRADEKKTQKENQHEPDEQKKTPNEITQETTEITQQAPRTIFDMVNELETIAFAPIPTQGTGAGSGMSAKLKAIEMLLSLQEKEDIKRKENEAAKAKAEAVETFGISINNSSPMMAYLIENGMANKKGIEKIAKEMTDALSSDFMALLPKMDFKYFKNYAGEFASEFYSDTDFVKREVLSKQTSFNSELERVVRRNKSEFHSEFPIWAKQKHYHAWLDYIGKKTNLSDSEANQVIEGLASGELDFKDFYRRHISLEPELEPGPSFLDVLNKLSEE